MAMRHDALTAAAEFTLAVEAFGAADARTRRHRRTVQVAPGASNVIPGRRRSHWTYAIPTTLCVWQAVDQLRAQAEDIAQRRGVQLDWRAGKGRQAWPARPRLTDVFCARGGGGGLS